MLWDYCYSEYEFDEKNQSTQLFWENNNCIKIIKYFDECKR